MRAKPQIFEQNSTNFRLSPEWATIFWFNWLIDVHKPGWKDT